MRRHICEWIQKLQAYENQQIALRNQNLYSLRRFRRAIGEAKYRKWHVRATGGDP